jgi:hypothetical protein
MNVIGLFWENTIRTMWEEAVAKLRGTSDSMMAIVFVCPNKTKEPFVLDIDFPENLHATAQYVTQVTFLNYEEKQDITKYGNVMEDAVTEIIHAIYRAKAYPTGLIHSHALYHNVAIYSCSIIIMLVAMHHPSALHWILVRFHTEQYGWNCYSVLCTYQQFELDHKHSIVQCIIFPHTIFFENFTKSRNLKPSLQTQQRVFGNWGNWGTGA